ncbi:uncharacterized protein LOC109794648, partial [Cajanus cajan]|uniref:uncharacterized protein LOC109794648 n=1 Tax=Cajanus cajan TaxID=3821 RepID=UPI00098D7FB0
MDEAECVVPEFFANERFAYYIIANHLFGLITAIARTENFKIPRQEYNDYCQWAAHQLPNVVFDSHVKSVEKSSCGVGYVVTVIQNGISHRYHARHVVIGTGTQPTLPKVLQAVANDMPNRCMHSANFARQFDLSALKKHIDIPHILVIGSGQSSAEVYRHLLQQQYTDSKLNYELDW